MLWRSVLNLFYQHGGDVSGRHPNTKSTVLHVACSRGLFKIVKYLLQFCKYGGYLGFFATTNVSCYQELDINSCNNHGLTALQVAASKGMCLFPARYSWLLLNGSFPDLLYVGTWSWSNWAVSNCEGTLEVLYTVQWLFSFKATVQLLQLAVNT